MRFFFFVWLFLLSSFGLTSQSALDMSRGPSLSNYQKQAFSQYSKTETFCGFSLKLSKCKKNLWHLKLNYSNGSLNSNVDRTDKFFSVYVFDVNYEPLIIDKSAFKIGSEISFFDGLVAQSPFSNNKNF